MKKFINVRLKGRQDKVEILVDDGVIVAVDSNIEHIQKP